MKVNATISTLLVTTKNFQDKHFAEKVITTMHQLSNFSPTVYDASEPLKKNFDIEQLDEMIDLWMNTEMNKLWYEKDYASGSFIATRKKVCKTEYFISWKKNQQAHFNIFSLRSNPEELAKKNYFHQYMELTESFIGIVEPVYGEIGVELRNESKPINLRIRCPELKWMVIFGAPYIKLFGREKLLSTPCYKVHEFSENLIGLQLVESVHDEIPDEIRKVIKEHLGEDAFVSDGKGIHRYKDGLAPTFDFSQVLFDPSKPIVEPQILTRKR